MTDNIIADVFNSDVFQMMTMTAAIQEIAFVPTRLGDLGIFDSRGIPTTSLLVERVGDTLVLVQSSPRGGAGQTMTPDRRNMVDFQCVHLQLEDQLFADELQNLRKFGDTRMLAGVIEQRDLKLSKMSRSLDLTLEYHRLGAVQGLVLDADGSVLFDLFDKFGISEYSATALPLDGAFDTTTSHEVIKPMITSVKREVSADLGGMTPSGYVALCGDDFFDKFQGHPEVREVTKLQDAKSIRNDGRDSFVYAGVEWENYRGVGNVKIADGEARLIPLGVPELFQQVFSPADVLEAVNTNGLVKYALAVPDPSGKNKFIDMEAQSNPITICTRPKVLRKFTIDD